MPARLRVALIYRWRHGRWPRLARPQRLTELVQRRKLEERDARWPALIDKVTAKVHVARMLGPESVTPTLWTGTVLPAVPPAPLPLVVKARHGSGQTAFVRTVADWQAARRRTARWVRRHYGAWLDEWAYGEVPRGLLVEPWIGPHGTCPVDYKMLVAGGRVHAIEVHLVTAAGKRWTLLDREWRSLGGSPCPVPRPRALPDLLRVAERLAEGHVFVRVDLYAIDDAPRFGELTFYPGSGLWPIEPDGQDHALGAAWLAAQ